MKARLYAIVFAALSMAGFSPAVLADNDSNNVSWKRVIGIIQAGNVVGNIPGGNQPWSTLGGDANVNLRSGRVEFEVRGLVLAGGNAIGTPATVNLVKGTIVCGPGGSSPGSPPLSVVDTPLVPLSAQGDAEFDGNVGHFPAGCAPNNLAFLVRIDAGRWIANGAVRSSP
jgi:hypothetical protein